MSAFWTGFLTLPAAIVAVLSLWLAVKAAGWLGERLLVGGTMRLTPATPERRRAAVSAVIYSGRRVWMVAPGDVGIALIVGMDGDEAAKAARRLEPRIEGVVLPSARPRPKHTPNPTADTEEP